MVARLCMIREFVHYLLVICQIVSLACLFRQTFIDMALLAISFQFICKLKRIKKVGLKKEDNVDRSK